MDQARVTKMAPGKGMSRDVKRYLLGSGSIHRASRNRVISKWRSLDAPKDRQRISKKITRAVVSASISGAREIFVVRIPKNLVADRGAAFERAI